MTELDTKARAILDAARCAYEPTPDDQKRIRAALSPALVPAPEGAPTQELAGSSQAAASTAGSAVVAKLVAGGVVIGAVGFGGGFAVGQATPPEPARQAAHPSIPETPSNVVSSAAPPQHVAPGPTAQDSDEVEQEHASLHRMDVPRKKAHPVASGKAAEQASTLGEEVTLLRRAQRALRNGDAPGSLALLDWMAERYPSGALQQERTAARVLALCGAGRSSEARAVADRFLARHPKSVHAARIRTTCAFSGSGQTGK